MWANRDWVGGALPGPVPAGRELAAYAAVCNAVEGNTTFYGIPRPSTVERWVDQAPEAFRFVFKLPRRITHDQRLRGSPREVGEFCERLAPLGPRLGPTSVQLPASFGPADLAVLDRFLAGLPSSLRWAVEVRHRDFCEGGEAEHRLNDLLATRDVDRVLLDTRALFAGPATTPAEREAFERKPRLTVRAVATARRPIVRFIGQTSPGTDPQFLARWVQTFARWIGDGRRPYFFAHTPDNRRAPMLARSFHAEVGRLVTDLAPLPVTTGPAEPDTSQTQPNLFGPEPGPRGDGTAPTSRPGDDQNRPNERNWR